jgi:hypothetical protein
MKRRKYSNGTSTAVGAVGEAAELREPVAVVCWNSGRLLPKSAVG